jgi:hypothetical protein
MAQSHQAERQQAAQFGTALSGCHLVGWLAVGAGSFGVHRVFHEVNATRVSQENNAVQTLMGTLRKRASQVVIEGHERCGDKRRAAHGAVSKRGTPHSVVADITLRSNAQRTPGWFGRRMRARLEMYEGLKRAQGKTEPFTGQTITRQLLSESKCPFLMMMPTGYLPRRSGY